MFNGGKIHESLGALRYIDILTFKVWKLRISNIGGAMKFMCVYANIVISKIRILKSRFLDPNQEHQILIPIVSHLEGVNRLQTNQMQN